jgi:MoaA/NifB/PqqE/SkfB family radical SAM enzyme
MRRASQTWESSHLVNMLSNVRRRSSWLGHPTPRQLANLLLSTAEFSMKREKIRAWPVIVKVDISPLCNLHCTYCVHARPAVGATTTQLFNARQWMSVADFRRIVDEVAGKSMALSLYYLGDPLVHPDLDEMCWIARRGRVNSHISTNFSFNLSDERLRNLVTSGLTHLTVAVDASRQETYERTRVGGRLEVVLDNLDRLLRFRRELRQARPHLEVQFIKFQHNLGEMAAVARWCSDRGVDQFTTYWGNLHNYEDVAPNQYNVFGPKANRLLPQCTWPYFSLQIKYNGDVIPCCYYREAEQYRADGDARIVGNVFQTSIRDVWNSPPYRQLRRLVANPRHAARDPSAAETFCHGCSVLYHTDRERKVLTADKHRWEDIYVRDERGTVRRRDDARRLHA